MKDIFLIYSEEQRSLSENYIRPAFPSLSKGLPLHNDVVICDAETGKFHIVTEVTTDPNYSQFKDKSIKGPFDKAQLIYFQYANGSKQNISAAIEHLPAEAQERVQKAHLEYSRLVGG